MSTSSVAIFSSTSSPSDGAARLAQLENELAIARAALDGSAEGVVVVDTRNWRIRQINAPALVLLDLDGAALPGSGFDAICRRLRTEDGSTPTPAALLLAAPEDGAYHYIRADGASRPVALRASRVRAAGRDLLVVALRDASARVRTAGELGAASTRCGITFSQAAIGLAHVALDGRWRRVNARLAAIVGYTEAELLSMTVRQTTHPDDSGHDATAYRRLLDGEIAYTTREKRYVRKDGTPVWVSVNSSLARDADGAPQYFIAMVEDITERKRAERRIRHLATHDAMTGLPNRAGLQHHLDGALRAARASGLRVGVAFVDMDKLKEINDSRGHEAGDLALVDLARQLRGQVRTEDMVARIGGDEFVIVLSDVATQGDIAAILDRVMRAPAVAACSIGVSVFPEDGDDARTLIRHADLAMYRAKQAGGARYAFFHPTDTR